MAGYGFPRAADSQAEATHEGVRNDRDGPKTLPYPCQPTALDISLHGLRDRRLLRALATHLAGLLDELVVNWRLVATALRRDKVMGSVTRASDRPVGADRPNSFLAGAHRHFA